MTAPPELLTLVLGSVWKSSITNFPVAGPRTYVLTTVVVGATPAELTWKAGVDVLSFGGTKGGCWQAEAVVFFDPAKARDFQFIRKRSGHLISKNRFVAAQFKAYLKDNAASEATIAGV